MTATPMMRQYQDAKAACPDAILLFRMGDFYELFHDDAKTAAQVLNLALTSREKGENAIPMAGFPHHQLETYLGKLIAAGLRVAICDQVEDPREAKGLVKRELTRIVSRGTVTDDALLDPRENNFLAALVPGKTAGLAWVEFRPDVFTPRSCRPIDWPTSWRASHRSNACWAKTSRPPPTCSTDGMLITRRPNWAFAQHAAHETLAKHFGTNTLEGFGFRDRGYRRDPRRRRHYRLSRRDPKSLDRPCRPPDPLSARHGARNRRGHAPQPGNQPHAARRPAAGLSSGSSRPHGHGHGLAPDE